MENSFQTSFIPKRPIIDSGDSSKSKEPVSLFSVISVVLIVISVLASGGLFAYKLYLTRQKDELSKSLLRARDSFEQDTINELGLFDERVKSAKEVISNHVALSNVFSHLEDITIPQVQYVKFEEQMNDKGILTANLSGIASDYRSIAIQADMFSSDNSSPFKNVLFSNLSRMQNGTVSFNLKFDIDSSAYLYTKNLSKSDKVLPIDSFKTINNVQP